MVKRYTAAVSKAMRAGMELFRIFRRHQADIRQIAIALGEVHPVTDDKQVGDGESDVIGFDLLHAPRGLVEQRGNAQRLGMLLQKELAQRSEEHTSELQSRGHLVC